MNDRLLLRRFDIDGLYALVERTMREHEKALGLRYVRAVGDLLIGYTNTR
jgi:hypothetical protein